MIKSIKKCRIYSFYYQQKNNIIPIKNYIPVWVGKNRKKMLPGFTGDDTGDNISSKN